MRSVDYGLAKSSTYADWITCCTAVEVEGITQRGHAMQNMMKASSDDVNVLAAVTLCLKKRH